ncbi:hypothetical protein V8F20_001735 [Naviculisporaceae sp. PSN 640]
MASSLLCWTRKSGLTCFPLITCVMPLWASRSPPELYNLLATQFRFHPVQNGNPLISRHRFAFLFTGTFLS